MSKLEEMARLGAKVGMSLKGPYFKDLGLPGGIFANNGLVRAHSHAHAYYPSFSVRVDKAMRTENLRMVTAMRTTIALIFCAHDISHAHRKSRVFEQSHGHKHGFSKSSHTHSLGADMMT